MKNTIIFLISIIISLNSIAQNLKYADFKWEEKPVLTTLSENEKNESEVIISRNISYEFVYDENQLKSYFFLHIITKVNTDEAIDENNKIYIPINSNSKLIETKARVINSKGEIKELDKNDMKTAIDEESQTNYTYFALEGIDKGSEIEYYYYIQRQADLTGISIYIQNEFIQKKVKFSLICPENLVFTFKSFNGLGEVKKDTLEKEYNNYILEVDNLIDLKEEEMANYEANLQYLIFKLSANTSTNKVNLNSYSTVAQNYYKMLNLELSKKNIKDIENILKNSKANDEDNLIEKLRLLENYLKLNYTENSSNQDYLDDLDFLLSNKIGSSMAIMRLYNAIFNQLNIEFQIVITSNRYDQKFDNEFEAYCFLKEELFYFPTIDKYISPIALFSRIGYLPPAYFNNYALFIKPVKLGEFSSATGKIKFISPTDASMNSDTLDVNVQFSDDITSPNISFVNKQKGLDVLNIQPVFDYVKGDDLTKIEETLAKIINKDLDVENVKIENKGGINFGKKPLITYSTIKQTSEFIEKAGNKYLFKVGLLIGPQMELYQEKDEERKQDIELNYNHSYYRTIVFNIPEGYKINNLNDLNINKFLEYNDRKSSYFNSSFKIEDNKVVIKIEEVYDEINYPKSLFENYRNVINAAADFNKISLILEKM